jgi:NAD(P)-dependent dehydrogenase (short-subunit alcohol dehydrogenase family)
MMEQIAARPVLYYPALFIAASLGLYVFRWLFIVGRRNPYRPDMANKYAIVTGGNGGIGLEAAVELAKLGTHVVIACRDSDKTRQAVARIKQESGNTHVTAETLELDSLDSVRAFAHQYIRSGRPLHILMNNAGIMWIQQRTLTKDGFEQQLAVNHFGHFLLTHLLLPVLKKSAPARIINVSSVSHETGKIYFDDLQMEHCYGPYEAYAQTKLANILHANELGRRLEGTGVTANSCHPGGVMTEITRHLDQTWWMALTMTFLKFAKRSVLRTPWQGAQTQLMMALGPECADTSGMYWDNCRPSKSWMNPFVGDRAVEKKLWEVTMDLLKLDDADV